MGGVKNESAFPYIGGSKLSRRIHSTTSISTSLSARSLTVHLGLPFGGSEHAKRVNCASIRPSILGGAPLRAFSYNAESKTAEDHHGNRMHGMYFGSKRPLHRLLRFSVAHVRDPLFRLGVAILMDINEEWLTGRKYLSLKKERNDVDTGPEILQKTRHATSEMNSHSARWTWRK